MQSASAVEVIRAGNVNISTDTCGKLNADVPGLSHIFGAVCLG